jgi:hypothetical protein
MATPLPLPQLLAIAAATAGTLMPGRALADFNAPYVASYSYSGKLSDCVSGGRKALEKHGFEIDEVKYIDNNKSALIYAGHRDLALGATIECDPSRGKGAWGVAGPNDQDAFEFFKKLGAEAW